MSIDNKKINIVSDVNFDGNNITDAKINAQENTISNLEVSNFKSGVIQTTVRDTTNALDTVIPTEKAVSEALSNIQVNVIELDEGTNIDNLREEGTFFIKNPTGTLPSAVSTGGTYWCVVTQEKCYDDLNLGTYWYLQTVKFTYLGAGPGIGTLPSWQTYTRQITDYQYVTGNMWQRLDNIAEKVFGVSLVSSNANATIGLSSYSNNEYLSVVSLGMLSDGTIRTVSTLNLDEGLLGSCKVVFKTGSGTFSITLSAYLSAQLLNANILTNYSFKSNTLYIIYFQQSSNTKYSVQVIEIDKPFVQEYFPSQTGNSGMFLTTNGSTLAWSEVGAGANLYDIKKLSQAVADKGWTYLCNDTKQMLSKTNIPTVYNDIEEKYFNVDKEFTGDFSNLVSTSSAFGFAIDDDYIYTTINTTWVLKKTLISALPNINWVDVGLVNKIVTNTNRFTVASGKNLLIALEYVDNNNSIFRIYNKSNMQVLKTYNNAGGGAGNKELPFVKLYKIKGKDVFILSYKIEDNRCGIVFIDDNINLNIVEKEFPYNSIGVPAYASGDTFFFTSKDITDTQHYYSAVFKTTDKFSTWTKKRTFQSTLTYDYDLQTCFCIGNNISISRNSYVSTDFGETWSQLPSGDNRNRADNIQPNSYFDGTILYGITNSNSLKKLIVTSDLLNYSVILDTNYAYNSILLSRDKTTFVAHRGGNYNLDVLDWTKIVYTDNYTIGGATVAIQYYKFNDWKICISDGGTNDTNLDTIYNSLGYTNYWLLDTTNQQLCLPRNSNLYTQMYVGDDYEDLTTPTGTWSAVALKSELQELIPDQSGQSGKFLTTNGTTASWATVVQQSAQVNTFNGTLTSNTLSLNTEIDLSESIILSVYVNGIYQIDSTNYSITTSNEESTITFSSSFNENVTISIVYATNISLTNLSYNDLTDKPTIDTLLPTQTGNSGKFLTTNGTTAGWVTVSSGTTDYTDLSNKPSINGVTLTGNVSLSSLGVQSQNIVIEDTPIDMSMWNVSNRYPEYGYECAVNCPGATTTSFAQVVFEPTEFDSGNYANVCVTGLDSVTVFSKVNATINIPTIIVMGA